MKVPMFEYFLLEFISYSLINGRSYGGNYTFCKHLNIYDLMIENNWLRNIKKEAFE